MSKLCTKFMGGSGVVSSVGSIEKLKAGMSVKVELMDAVLLLMAFSSSGTSGSPVLKREARNGW